ncbi:hypothetical protein LINGRAHAP2_LOCUS30513 [Linum grandiflorum]
MSATISELLLHIAFLQNKVPDDTEDDSREHPTYCGVLALLFPGYEVYWTRSLLKTISS